jgi:hypothetical protein
MVVEQHERELHIGVCSQVVDDHATQYVMAAHRRIALRISGAFSRDAAPLAPKSGLFLSLLIPRNHLPAARVWITLAQFVLPLSRANVMCLPLSPLDFFAEVSQNKFGSGLWLTSRLGLALPTALTDDRAVSCYLPIWWRSTHGWPPFVCDGSVLLRRAVRI